MTEPIRRNWRTVLLLGLLVLVLDAMMLGLAHWQYQKGVRKEALRWQALETRELEPLRTSGPVAADLQRFRRLQLAGQWVGQPLFLDNQIWQGRAGYQVLMAYQPAQDQRCLLVRRGWMRKDFGAAPHWQPGPPLVPLHAEVAAWPRAQPLLLQGRVVQGLDPAALQPLLPCRLHPLLFEETAAASDGLQRQPPLPAVEEIGKHWSYTGQWLLFTLLLSGAYVVYVVRSSRRQS